MILTEIASGEVRSAATDLNLLIEGPTERIRIPVAFVEDELNLGLPEGYLRKRVGQGASVAWCAAGVFRPGSNSGAMGSR